jgi:hypothetical protein
MVRRTRIVLALVTVAFVTLLQAARVPAVPAFGNAPASASPAGQGFERNWVRVPGPQPPAGGNMAYDSVHHQTVLFVPNSGAGQTWVFDGSTRTWTRRAPANNPPLYSGLLAFDAARGDVVLFGSAEAPDLCTDTTPGQTWTWDGTDWSLQHPARAPGECFHGTATYDAARRVSMFYGAGQFDEPANWTWDGSSWTSRPTGPYGAAALAYDARTRRVMAFGGGFYWHGENMFGSTLAWDGTRWTRLASGGGRYDPRARESATMFYDPVVGAPLLTGGWSTTNLWDRVLNRDLWRWTGTHWVRIATRSSPPAAALGAFAYDTDHRFGVLRIVGQTWLFTSASAGHGSVLAASDGRVIALGDARPFGSAAGIALQAPVVGIARTVTRNGYWLVASDGGVFAFGDARFYGGTGGFHINQPIVGIAATPSGLGYWLVARDGGIFAFGDARFAGSTGNIRLNRPIVGMAPTPTGDGYWLVASDGGIFAFGDARYFGSTGTLVLRQPVVGMSPTPPGDGYWLVTRDGGVFGFGAARFHGAAPGPVPVVGIASSATGDGYWTFTSTGWVSVFGDAPAYPSVRGGTFGIVGAVAT